MVHKHNDGNHQEQPAGPSQPFAERGEVAVEERPETPAEPEQAEPNAEQDLKEQLAEKDRQIEEYKARLLRLQADFENFRRRAAKEREELADVVAEGILLHFLPVIDNLERALAAAAGEQGIISGVELIHRQFRDVLTRLGVTVIPTVGEKFDPQRHEAVMHAPSDTEEEDTIVEELQKGYQLKAKVLRPSMVKIVKNN